MLEEDAAEAEWLQSSFLHSADSQSCLQQLNQLNNTMRCHCCAHKPVKARRGTEETLIKTNK